MVKLVSDNKTISKTIERIEALILEKGGWLSPDLCIESEGGNLAIKMEGFPDPRGPLIAVPEELLLHVGEMNISAKNDELLMNPEAGKLSKAQEEMGNLMLELYNLTDKLKLNRESSCWLKFRKNKKPLEALLKARTLTNNNEKMFELMDKTDKDSIDKVECDAYLKTRTIGLAGIDGRPDDNFSTYLMPIIDFMNHHPDGSGFNIPSHEDCHTAKRFMQVFDHRPLPANNECFAFYNQMDALDSFISYGFPDIHANAIRSIPMEIDLGKAGKLVIESIHWGMVKQKLHKSIAGLRPYIPTTMESNDELLKVTHILIPCTTNAPNALRRVLRMIISSKAAKIFKAPEVQEYVLKAEQEILDANRKFYEDLLSQAKAHIEKGDDADLWGLIKMVSEIQLRKLLCYQFDVNYFEGKPCFNPEKKSEALSSKVA